MLIGQIPLDNRLVEMAVDCMCAANFASVIQSVYSRSGNARQLSDTFMKNMRLYMVAMQMEIVHLNSGSAVQNRFAHTGQESLCAYTRVAHLGDEYSAASSTDVVNAKLAQYVPPSNKNARQKGPLVAIGTVAATVLARHQTLTLDKFMEHIRYATSQIVDKSRSKARVAKLNKDRTDVTASLNLYSEIVKQDKKDRVTLYNAAMYMLICSVEALAQCDRDPTLELLASVIGSHPNTHIVQRCVLSRLGLLPTQHNNKPVYTAAIQCLGRVYRADTM